MPSRSSCDRTFEDAVKAVLQFSNSGDVVANESLLSIIDHSLDAGGTPAAHTLAPQLLNWAVTEAMTTGGPVSPAAVVYVCVLNRHFCVNVLLRRLAQPVDLRPTGLEELQQLYLSTLPVISPQATSANTTAACAAAHRQITQCIACLLIVLETHLADRLQTWMNGTHAVNGEASLEQSRLALHTFVAVTDLLSDRRVAVGPIRRATQRRELQERISMVIQSPLREETDMPLLVHATDSAIHFLLEAMHGEPQEVAATFWSALPNSTVWHYCLRCLEDTVVTAAPVATPTRSEEVLSLVCNALRCLTTIDAAAVSLLSGALPPVLQPLNSSMSADWEAISRVIAAALEASTEAIVMRQASEDPLFHLFSCAAERVSQLLLTPQAPPTAVCYICEGVSALTQTLQPSSIPAMEPDDDPEDFELFARSLREANAEKAAAMEKLKPFLQGCEKALAMRLTCSGFTRSEWSSIASYVAQHTVDDDAADYQVAHDELELALFTTYERLLGLLGIMSIGDLMSVTPDSAQQLVLIMGNGEHFLSWVESAGPSELFTQSVLLPCCVARHAAPGRELGQRTDSLLRTADALLRALSTATPFLRDGHDTLAVLDVAEAATTIVMAIVNAGVEAAQLRDRCAPLVSLLWKLVVFDPAMQLSVSTRHAAVEQLSKLLRHSVVLLPHGAVAVLMGQDAYTQTVLLASAAASHGCLDTMDMFAHALHCFAQLSTSEVSIVERQWCHDLTGIVQRHCQLGKGSGDALAELLHAWHRQHPHLLLPFLMLSEALPALFQSPLVLAGLKCFFSQPQGRDTSTLELQSILSERYVWPMAASVETAWEFHGLLQWLLQPHPSFTASDGVQRICALSACGRALAEGGHVPAMNLMDSLVACIARWQEFRSATALGEEASSHRTRDEEDETMNDEQQRQHTLEQLAVWSRCMEAVPLLPAGTPSWLARLQSAGDDYERMEILKGI